MKRSEALAILSRDHHRALVAAQRLKRADAETTELARAQFLAYWADEGRRHFQLEEELLLPAFASHGDARHPLVLRVLGDHVTIRSRAAQLAATAEPAVTALHELGSELAAHVRLEERELFPVIEAAIPAGELLALARALDQSGACRLGVLAFGDSITNGGGELQWGVALQSWALWTARALGLPYSPYAVDGATAEDVVALQIPLYQRVVGSPGARYTLGCLYIGTNDVRLPGFDVARFEQRHGEALAFLKRRCEHVLTLTIPLDMGRPRNPALVEATNAAIERSAAAAGAAVLDLRAFGGRGLMMADHVHPTALGQVAIAERALDRLQAAGLPPRIRARELIDYETTWWARLRGDATYAYRHIKQDLRLLLRAARDG